MESAIVEPSIILETNVVSVVNEILGEALRLKASDIHIEPKESLVNLRFRVDGQFVQSKQFLIGGYGFLNRRIKLLAGLKLDESRLPQDGKTSAQFGQQQVDFRVSTFPTIHGEKIVIRVLFDELGRLDLSKLGFFTESLDKIHATIKKSQGLVLCTGPTGSGKSTTLFSMIREYDPSAVNISTLEDPVEYQLPGITQTQANPSIGLTFSEGLRSLVRQDVDVIMVGEIRDRKTVELAIDASLTGHAVYSSIHANSAVATITRLQKMGIESFLLASALRLVIAQRLHRRLCPHCKKQETPTSSIVSVLEPDIVSLFPKPLKETNFYVPVGCDACQGKGYIGRIVVEEILEVTPEISDLIVQGAPESKIEKVALEQGMLTLKQSGILKAALGEISLSDALRYE